MAPSFFISSLLLFLMFFFQFSSTQSLCREFERLALEQFKHTFLIKRNASRNSLVYPKTDLWKSQGSDCCSWEGITCSQHTGHVVGIELNSSCLFGSINSSSSLFNLGHLRYLNLADNHFNYSSIPPAFGNLSRLISLDLSHSWFSGQVPFEISKLSKLTKIDLSSLRSQRLLSLKTQDFKILIHNLTQLEYLNLFSVNINSSVPRALANLSSLAYLDLSLCELFGEFPNAIFELPKLEKLFVTQNFGLNGILPEFHYNNPLKELTVSETNFSWELPKSVGLLTSLNLLGAANCNLSGFFPSLVPSNLTRLRVLDLSLNHITGPFPSWLTNLTQLTVLSLLSNMIQGALPSSISKLENLETFIVAYNNLSGTVESDTFLGLEHLKYLFLSGNPFSLVTKNTSTNITSTKLVLLGLSSCNLKEFPAFLHNQDQLEILDLSSNNIHGQIPKWLLKSSPNLLNLDLSNNSLTSFEANSSLPPNLFNLDLSFNFLKGSLPIPSPSMAVYEVADNSFDGEIPPDFCNITSLELLDLSQNNLSGIIPQCFGNHTKSLSTLEYLDLSNNQIRDAFPSWLGVLPRLKIIILRSNRFYGAINDSGSESLFPELRIIDLSHNEFVGSLPLKYFQQWNVIANHDEDKATYLMGEYGSELDGLRSYYVGVYSVTITNKGNQMEYEEILEIFTAIDLSCNRFSGGIPEIVGNLRKLELLNLSNNILVGPIPPALRSLSNLEALDLSNNKLKGRIPTELTQLNFLEVFDVSNNLLTGSIPRGSQFNTFENSSFEGNPGLCGMPLSKKCGNHAPPLPSSSEKNGHVSLLSEIGWRAVLIGCVCGFLGGVVLGVKVFARKQEWLMETFRIKQGRRRSGVRRR